MPSTESITGEQQGYPDAQPARKVIYLPTVEVYDKWAATYDTDGNILQALDTYGLISSLLPRLLAVLAELTTPHDSATHIEEQRGFGMQEDHNGRRTLRSLYVIDLGCGTGRASHLFASAITRTQKQSMSPADHGIIDLKLVGYDSSEKMLELAKAKLKPFEGVGPSSNYISNLMLDFVVFDIGAGAGDVSKTKQAHAIISTLVIEHIPLDVYFAQARELLDEGGFLLLTNMHEDMGNATFTSPCGADKDRGPIPTGAGFNDATSNSKIRGTSFAHKTIDILRSAKAVGLRLVGDVEELTVQDWMLSDARNDQKGPLLGPRGKKWVGTKCWCGMILELRNKTEI